MTRRLELSFTNMSDRIKLFFEKKKKSWLEELIFWKYQSKYRNFILMTQRIEFFFWKTWLTEIELFFPTWLIVIEPFFFWHVTQRIEPFLNVTQRIEPFWMWRKELNFSWIWRKDWSFSPKFWQKNQWIEPSFQKWFKELNMTQRIELFFFFNVTQRIQFLNSFYKYGLL